MGYLEKNLAVLRRCYPGFEAKFSQLLAAHPAGEDAALFELVPSAAGQPTLKAGGRFAHSSRDPAQEAARLAERAAAQEADGSLPEGGAVVVLGFGLGYSAEAAARRFPRSVLVIVEKRPALFRSALESRDLTPLFDGGKPILILGGDAGSVLAALEAAKGVRALLKNRELTRLDADWYAQAERHIRLWKTKDEVNAATLRRFGSRWERNIRANLWAIRDLPGIDSLCAAFPYPVLLVAAGPSLDEAAGLLPALAERCLVVSVDTALRFCLRAGFAPDFVVSCDGQYWNARHLDRCPLRATALLADPAVYPSTLRLPFKRAFLCGAAHPLARRVEEQVGAKRRVGAGGSVATTAWDFARNLTTQAVYILGLDLAFPGLRTHFSGALFEERAHTTSGRLHPAETTAFRALRDGGPFFAPAANGRQVLTDQRLSLYAAWFENRLKEPGAPPSYRLNPQGLAIPGLPTCDPSTLLSLPPRRPQIQTHLARTYSTLDTHWQKGAPTRLRRFTAALATLPQDTRHASIPSAARAAHPAEHNGLLSQPKQPPHPQQ